jgi:nucleotide-binding universal stress UspA family protein
MLRSVLAAVDLLPGSQRVLRRVARLPLLPTASVTLLHVIPDALPAAVRHQAHHDAGEALEAMAARLRTKAGVRVDTMVLEGTADDLISRRARAQDADLVVVGRVGARSIKEVFIGATAERVVRRGARPTLVVRLPGQEPYARPVVALDDDEAVDDALGLTLAVLAPPRPAVTVVHAYDAPLQNLAYPSLSAADARAYRDAWARQAKRRLTERLEAAKKKHAASARQVTWHLDLVQGPPRLVIPDAVSRARADLLVLGTRGHGALARAFLGTVAGDVLREVPCDVLVVPPGAARPAR